LPKVEGRKVRREVKSHDDDDKLDKILQVSIQVKKKNENSRKKKKKKKSRRVKKKFLRIENKIKK